MTETDRPLVTFALFAYNQEKYIREAVEGAFAQTYEPLEIILSDDCSSDRTFEIMQEMAAAYDGPHEVRVRQSESNRRLAGHINDVIAISNGTIISWAAGDDIAKPERTAVFVSKLLESTEYVGVHSNVTEIDLNGNHIRDRRHSMRDTNMSLQNSVRRGHSVITQSHAFYKCIFDKFGPFRSDLTQEGIAMAFRESTSGKVAFVEDFLTFYRIGSGISTYSGIDFKKIKDSEPVKYTNWYLTAFRQMHEDSGKLNPPLLPRHIKSIENNISFFSSLLEINLGNSYFMPLIKNFFILPKDTRSIRAVFRKLAPIGIYRKIKG